MEEKKKYTAQERYDKSNAIHIGMKLNKKTDADILAAIDGKCKQTELKRLIRIGLHFAKTTEE